MKAIADRLASCDDRRSRRHAYEFCRTMSSMSNQLFIGCFKHLRFMSDFFGIGQIRGMFCACLADVLTKLKEFSASSMPSFRTWPHGGQCMFTAWSGHVHGHTVARSGCAQEAIRVSSVLFGSYARRAHDVFTPCSKYLWSMFRNHVKNVFGAY